MVVLTVAIIVLLLMCLRCLTIPLGFKTGGISFVKKHCKLSTNSYIIFNKYVTFVR